MPSFRRLLPLGLAAALVSAPAGFAAPVCNLIPVDPGSTRAYGSTTDIESGDVATGGRTLVAVLRMKSVAFKSDPAAVLGAEFWFRFKIDGALYSLYYSTAGAVAGSERYDLNGATDGVAVRVDEAAKSIIWTVQRSKVKELRAVSRVRKTLTDIGGTTQASGVWFKDTALARSNYVDRTASCVRVS